MRFTKAHGTGNDFVLLPDLDDRFALTEPLVRALCTPHTGLGADGVIRIGSSPAGADALMDYRNADGSIAEMCANGLRSVAKYLVDRGFVEGPSLSIETRSGVKQVSWEVGPDGRVARVTVDLGEPVPLKVDLALDVDGHGTVHVTTLSVGNPHAVVVVDDVAAAPLSSLGPALQRHPEFAEGVNVEVIAVQARDRVVGRIFERGVGETLASGSGASAMAVAASLLDLADRRVDVHVPGGVLIVDWTDEGLTVTGPAVEVASGELDGTWLSQVAP